MSIHFLAGNNTWGRILATLAPAIRSAVAAAPFGEKTTANQIVDARIAPVYEPDSNLTTPFEIPGAPAAVF
jgi:hypothetical protein